MHTYVWNMETVLSVRETCLTVETGLLPSHLRRCMHLRPNLLLIAYECISTMDKHTRTLCYWHSLTLQVGTCASHKAFATPVQKWNRLAHTGPRGADGQMGRTLLCDCCELPRYTARYANVAGCIQHALQR